MADVELRDPWGRQILELVPTSSSDDSELPQPAVLKKANSRMAAAHAALSEAGIATPLLASGDGWTVEAKGRVRDWGGKPLEKEEDGALAARLHAAPVYWFAPFRKALHELLPVLASEPEASPLYPLVAACQVKRGKGQMPSLYHDEASASKLSQIMALLPRPEGHAGRPVTVHGDFWYSNVLQPCDASGQPRSEAAKQLLDFEWTCVSNAAQDMVHACDERLLRGYLRQTLGREPTELELEKLWFEARVAEHGESPASDPRPLPPPAAAPHWPDL